MASRLTLSTVGIKSPLDVQQAGERPAVESPTPERAPAKPTRSRAAARPRPTAAPTRRARPQPPEVRTGADAPFYGSGRPLQTSIALDAACVAELEQLARAARVSVNALAVAVLHSGLPLAADDARSAIVDERVRRAAETVARVERNLRLPEQLRVRVDELTAAAQRRLPRATRADLVNAALRRGLPEGAQAAAELVAGHAQRLERAAATAA
jgi:hypothetical protein